MRKLSEIKGAEAIKVIGEAIPIVARMVAKAPAKSEKNGIEFLGEILSSNPEDTVALIAVVDGKDKAEYDERSLLDMMRDTKDMMSDPDLMSLFK